MSFANPRATAFAGGQSDGFRPEWDGGEARVFVEIGGAALRGALRG